MSERTGRPTTAHLSVKNPQIINGGQTAYTLSKIYADGLSENKTVDVFDGKEVMLRIITFMTQVLYVVFFYAFFQL